MNNLTKEEVGSYIRFRDEATGVDGVSREYLETLNLDDVRIVEINTVRDRISVGGQQIYKLDSFTPRYDSCAFKPSFAGSQVLLGRVGRTLFFSDGVWFSSYI